MRLIAPGRRAGSRQPEHAGHERHVAFVENRRLRAKQGQHRAAGDGGHVDGGIEIGEGRVRHAGDGEGHRSRRRRREPGHPQQAVLVREDRVLPIDAQRRHGHSRVQREQQGVFHAFDVEPVVELGDETPPRFDDDPAVDAVHPGIFPRADGIVRGAPLGALADRAARRVGQRRRPGNRKRRRDAARREQRHPGAMIRARVQRRGDDQKSARQQQLARALGEVGALREARQHVGTERKRRDAGERRRQMRRHAGHHPPCLGAEQRQGHHRDDQAVPRQHREQDHQRTPQDQRRRRVHEQEHRHRIGLHHVAEGPLQRYGDSTQPLHSQHGDDQRQPRDQRQSRQAPAKQRQVAERPRIEHVRDAFPGVPGAHVECQEDDGHDHHPEQEDAHAGEDEARIDEADAGRKPGHQTVDPGIVGVGDKAEQNAQHDEQPCAHQPARRAHLRHGNGPEAMQFLHACAPLRWA